MRADLYARPRQKTMRLIFRALVTEVEPILICIVEHAQKKDVVAMAVWIGGQPLDRDEIDEFARRDGFPLGGAEMAAWWLRTHGPGAFDGQVIHWDYDRRFGSVGAACPACSGAGCQECSRTGQAEHCRADVFDRLQPQGVA